MKKIKIGSRGSKLSLAYVSKVKNLILSNFNELSDNDIDVKIIKTTGDIENIKKISEIGGKNLFCKEIEENLLDNKIDIAIHSLKDMETNENESLMIGAYIERNDPRDVIVSKKVKSIYDLKPGLLIGSSSRRRELQLKKINKEISIINMRGNIDTRIKNIKEKKLDAIILAAAGIKSLNLEKEIGFVFNTREVIPSAGQGVIAAQCRKKDDFVKKILEKINHKETSLCALAERSMLRTIGGDCYTAVGGLAEIKKNYLNLKAQLFSDDGTRDFNFELTGEADDAINIGKIVGQKLLNLAGINFKKK